MLESGATLPFPRIISSISWNPRERYKWRELGVVASSQMGRFSERAIFWWYRIISLASPADFLVSIKDTGVRLILLKPNGDGLTFSAVIVLSPNTEDIVVSIFTVETLLLSVICHSGEFSPQALVMLSHFLSSLAGRTHKGCQCLPLSLRCQSSIEHKGSLRTEASRYYRCPFQVE